MQIWTFLFRYLDFVVVVVVVVVVVWDVGKKR
jgi:hypothetical protein